MEYYVGKNNHIGVRCINCGKVIELPITKEEFLNWDGHNYIQEQFPQIASELREMLISGICPECWNKIFPPEE